MITEEQAAKMIKLLTEIEYNTSNISSSTINDLDSVVAEMQEIKNALYDLKESIDQG